MKMQLLCALLWVTYLYVTHGLMVQSLGGLSRGSLQFRQVHAVITSIAQSHQTLLMAETQDGSKKELRDIGVVLLAGGKGKRMKSNIPKQFLEILGKPVFLRSLEIFTKMRCVSNIVIVLDESYRQDYSDVVENDSRISWADPGVERQGSVFNGLSGVPDTCSLVAIHDSARPLVTQKEVEAVLHDATEHGAAVLGVPVKATIKESEDGAFVLKTVEVCICNKYM